VSGDCRRWSGPFAKFSRGEKGEKFHDDGANGPYLAVHRLFLFLLASGGPGVARNLGTFDSRFPAHERLAPTTAPIKGLGHLFSSPTPPHRAGHITSLLARVELHTDTSRALVLCSSRLHSPLCMATRRAPSFFLSEFGTVEENSRCRRACCCVLLFSIDTLSTRILPRKSGDSRFLPCFLQGPARQTTWRLWPASLALYPPVLTTVYVLYARQTPL